MSPGASHFLPGAPKGPQSSTPIGSSCTTGPDRKTEAQEAVRSSKIRIDKSWVLGDRWPSLSDFCPLWAPVTKEWGCWDGQQQSALESDTRTSSPEELGRWKSGFLDSAAGP